MDNQSAQTLFMGLATLFSLLNAVFAAFMWRMRATFVPRPEGEKEFAAVRSETTKKYDTRERRI